MRAPVRIPAMLLSALVVLYCAFTMLITWSEAGWVDVDPLLTACFLGGVAIFCVAAFPAVVSRKRKQKWFASPWM